ncbi:ubiquinone/menaquinone biosynthesis C-methylase UbiE [Amycolatopsis lexingtonensis]|uniref:Ubiquinone/menaquinone biosynthesis C-methylase UbiE n=1 Tax=Amycolatopsis lexingtonensis TaxID=218822 RepID=A0ABR9I771_9PSEU|nr:class I SAM-dependent methyltransferase [Amycolatopsis lexingtonensis]MBE1499034.1 ubiquinone/menaquinone biosynthesis C-methylase UbiE [Amycolatopsis lexingtonensis]
MPVPGTLEHPTREQLVRVQYADAELVADYAGAYSGAGPTARYHRSRLHAVDQVLREHPGGALLDVGCGPGMMVRHLLDDRPGDFAVTGCDRSAAMVDAARRRAGKGADFSVGDIREMPFADGAFDIALAMGVLEYVDIGPALHEIARVVRPGGLVVVTMLNPRSPYRLVEWGLYWPARRMLGGLEEAFHVPRRHGARRTGIRAYPPRRLRHELWRAGLQAEDTLFYDVTALLPPFDRLVRRPDRPERTVARGIAGRLGTGYLIAARRL